MASILPLVLALAAVDATPAAHPESARSEPTSEALDACGALPPEQQRACVEPFLDSLPPEQADLLRLATDVAVQEAARAWESDLDGAVQSYARARAARGTPRDKLAAVLAWPLASADGGSAGKRLPEEVLAWFADARAATPADPLVLWVEATDCAQLAIQCDQARAVERLLDADPGNAVPHLLAAVRTDDPNLLWAHVAHAARAPRFEPYDQQLLELMFASHQEIDWPPIPEAVGRAWSRAMGEPASAESWAMGRMAGFWMAMVNPTFNTGFCTSPVAGDKRRANCIAVLAKIASDRSSLIHPAMALPSLVRLTAGTEAGDAWRERLRQHYWVMERGMARGIGFGTPVPGSEFMAIRATQGELAAVHTLMRRIGEPLEAPPGWLPDEPHRRELLGVHGEHPDP